MKNNTTKNITLLVVALVIVGAITYLERQKPAVILPSNSPDVTVTPIIPVKPLPPKAANDRKASLALKATEYQKAKELADPTGFINTPPFKLSDIVGKKVVLIDFWTYSCINCLRTVPYLNAWYSKYKDSGLVIIGVHSPEFGFEKDYNNVSAAVKKLGIAYPVVLDSNMGTWNAYANQYWPAEYLIDTDGYVTDTHFGEGNYDVTEQKIQAVLKERAAILGIPDTVPSGIVNPNDAITLNGNMVASPETYFGASRNEYLSNGIKNQTGLQNLTASDAPQLNTLYLNGSWNFSREYAENTDTNGKIFYKYNAKNVYFVASSQNGTKIKIMLDGKPIDKSVSGADVAADGIVTIKENRLYDIVHGADYGTHTLEIDVQGTGLDAYTFTFG